jgi:hypothetical protein
MELVAEVEGELKSGPTSVRNGNRPQFVDVIEGISQKALKSAHRQIAPDDQHIGIIGGRREEAIAAGV